MSEDARIDFDRCPHPGDSAERAAWEYGARGELAPGIMVATPSTSAAWHEGVDERDRRREAALAAVPGTGSRTVVSMHPAEPGARTSDDAAVRVDPVALNIVTVAFAEAMTPEDAGLDQQVDAGRALVRELADNGFEVVASPDPSRGGGPDDPTAWLILYDEAGRPCETFSGHGATEAAHRRFEAVREGSELLPDSVPYASFP